jgi:tripartite ATP-independent transporter DctM subunit
MTDAHVAIIMLCLFIGTIFLGFPIAFTLLALAFIFGWYAMGERIISLIATNTSDVLSNDVLVAVPLFLFMGYLVERSNILDRLFLSIQRAARGVPGSLAIAALITCALFATATGIVGAVVTLMGLLAFPAMLKAGYDTRLAAGVICAGGTLGILIPPSIMLIVYAAAAGVSVVKLYAAAMLPGFLLAGLYLLYVVGRAVANPALAPPLPREEGEGAGGLAILLDVVVSFVPLAVLILAVLGAIFFGFATPTEAAAVGAFGAALLAACYRALTWKNMREAVYLTARTSAMVCFLFIGSTNFASVYSFLGGQKLVEEFMTSLDLSPFAFLLITQAVIFLLGWPLEWTEIIIIFVPIFLPLLDNFGIDPIFFGVLVALNLQTAFLSPPMAMSAFYLKGISPPHVTLAQIFGGCTPFMGMVVIAMILLYLFPGIALWLPSVLYR